MTATDGRGSLAWDEVHRRFGGWIRHKVRSFFPSDWEDVVQEAMLKLGKALPRHRDGRDEALRALVSRTVRSVCIDELRRRKRRPRLVEAGDEIAGDSATGAANAERADDRRLVGVAWDGLADRERRILGMRFREGLSFREIAEVMDVPQGSVAGWYSRALAKLRKKLEDVAS